MPKRLWISLVILLFVSPVIYSLIPTREGLQARRFNQAVSHLPVGSSKAEVAALIQNESLETSYVGNKSGIDDNSIIVDEGYNSSKLSGYYIAIIRHTSRNVIVNSAMNYFFFFDKKGKLIKTTTKEVFTGP